jgi:hypothetical protein
MQRLGGGARVEARIEAIVRGFGSFRGRPVFKSRKEVSLAVIHCTRKLAAKLPGVSAAALEEVDGLGNWHANLVRFDRVQCVLFCHDETRYCLFVPGMRARQFAELGRWHREL